MALELNLSRWPFTNRRPFWAIIIAVLAVCAVSAVWINQRKSGTMSRIADLQQRIKSHQDAVQNLQRLEEERKKEDAKIQMMPDEAYQLAAARQIIQAKTFSWDKLISDLESYVPDDTRVVGLKVGAPQAVDGGLETEVELGAQGKSTGQMTELMSRFDKSGGMFTVTDVNQGQINETGFVPFNMKLIYKPWAVGQGTADAAKTPTVEAASVASPGKQRAEVAKR